MHDTSLLRAGHTRIDAGFHYRFSTEVGSDMGRQVAEHVVKSLLLPLPTAALKPATPGERSVGVSVGARVLSMRRAR